MASAEKIFEEMMSAGEKAFGESWAKAAAYAPAEFRVLAKRIEDIARNVALYQVDSNEGYPPETGRVLLKMQRTACEGVLVASAKLTLDAVQDALDAMYDVLRKAFKGVVESIL